MSRMLLLVNDQHRVDAATVHHNLLTFQVQHIMAHIQGLAEPASFIEQHNPHAHICTSYIRVKGGYSDFDKIFGKCSTS